MHDILTFLQQHSTLSSLLLVTLALLMVLEFLKARQHAQRLNPNQVTQMINHQNAQVLDIRNQEAFVTGHIIGAVSVPAAELAARLKKLEKYKNAPVIVTCAQGTDGQRAATLLQKEGFNTFLLAGGMRSWRDAGMPVVKEK